MAAHATDTRQRIREIFVQGESPLSVGRQMKCEHRVMSWLQTHVRSILGDNSKMNCLPLAVSDNVSLLKLSTLCYNPSVRSE
jgi:hypothetical protein